MRLVAQLLFLSLLSGCIGNRSNSGLIHDSPGAKPTSSVNSEEAAIASILQTVRSGAKSDYKISPADLLQISIYREDDLARTLRVSQQGTISLPLIGDLQVGGMPVIKAQELIAARLSDFLVSPQVTVFIKEYGNKQIYVLGEVQKPGAFELPTESHLTVLEAVSMAGGFTPIAAKDRTRVIRSDSDGNSQSLMVEVTAITQRGEKSKDIRLEPNDVVFVPQSFF